MNRRRVLIAVNAAWNIFNFRRGLVKALLGAGYEVVVAAPSDAHAARLIDLGCRFIALPMDNEGVSPVRDLQLLLRFRGILARERPAVLLGFTIKPNVYGALAARSLGIPVINNVSGLGTAFIRQNWLTRLVKLLYRTALRRSFAVFFQNPDDRGLFVEAGLVREQQTALLPGSGINLASFAPHPPPSDSASTSFLLIARLLRDKGVLEYVEAARLVRAVFPAAQFRILGFVDVKNRTAIDRATVDGWVAEGAIDYLGATDDVRPFIAAADCVVLPSYREGTPRTLLEAAAMARPLVATDVPGCREVVDDGVNGYLCEVRNARDLADKLLQVCRLTPAERLGMGQASRNKVETQFDERIVIDTYLATIKRALDLPRR